MAAAITAASMTATAVINHRLTRSLELWGHCFNAVVVAIINKINKSSIILINNLCKSEICIPQTKKN